MRRLLAGLVVAGGIGLVACGGDDDPPTSRIFESPPWTAGERLRYDLVDQGDTLDGRCVLETLPETGPGETTLIHFCNDESGLHRDERTTVVASETLVPVSSLRVITNDEKGKRTSFTSRYDAEGVHLTADIDGEATEADRELPEPDEESPQPGYYDDESLFWVVRGIPLRDGYEGAYHNVNAGNGRIFIVEITVDGQEEVTVPAGTFTTWKVRVKTQSIEQTFWIDAAEPNRVVRARIERITYQLTAVEQP